MHQKNDTILWSIENRFDVGVGEYTPSKSFEYNDYSQFQ